RCLQPPAKSSHSISVTDSYPPRRTSGFGRLLVDQCRGVGHRFQAVDRDGLPGNLADPVGAVLDALKRSVDPRKSVLIEVGFSQCRFQIGCDLRLISLIADVVLSGHSRLDLAAARSDARLNLCPVSL